MVKRGSCTIFTICLLASIIFVHNGCQESLQKGSFEYDLAFLQEHKEVVVLKSEGDRCQVVIVPDYQGRVMTSTSRGAAGKSFGWINYDLIGSGEVRDHINVFGGEDRFWLGPEGGQYSIFFDPGTEFTFENWDTPAPIDTEPFSLVESSETRALFRQEMQLDNYAGYTFDIEVEREVALLGKSRIEKELDLKLDPAISYVGFQSTNSIKNTGGSAWSRETGLLSIWILGMFNPSDNTTIILPFRDSLQINTAYFGAIGPDRLTVSDRVVLFSGDGRYRCKIGLPPANALPVIGSYDAANNILTVVEYSFKGDTSYVNSLWKLQEDPYGGDVVNSYNDGPLEDGSQLGPFYELESSSSAKELSPGEMIEHVSKTYHFEGSRDRLNEISRKVLGFDLDKPELDQ